MNRGAIVIILFWVGLVSGCVGEPRVDRLGNSEFYESAHQLLYRGKPFSGVEIVRFPDGKIFSETRYRDGVKEGVSREFTTRGKLRAEWSFKNGLKDGVQKGWYIEGPRRFEQHYRNGVLDGTLTEWHLNGGVASEQTYASGVEVKRKILFATSEIYSNYSKRDGRIYGIDGGGLCMEVKRDGEL